MLKRIVVLLLLACMALPAAPKVLKDWTFRTTKDFQDWKASAGHLKDVRVADGVLKGVVCDWDGQMNSPLFDIAAHAWQTVEIKFKISEGGSCSIFYTGNEKASQWGGFKEEWQTKFNVIGDNQWHVYRVTPGWQLLKNIIRIRFDFPTLKPGDPDRDFEMEYIRILAEDPPTAAAVNTRWDFTKSTADWRMHNGSPMQTVATGVKVPGNEALELNGTFVKVEDSGIFVAVSMAVDKGTFAKISWNSSQAIGECSQVFRIKPDGRWHTYCLNLGVLKGWRGDIYRLTVQPTDAVDSVATVKSVFIMEDPDGSPDVVLRRAGMADAINRAGQPMHFQLLLANDGGGASKIGRITRFELPAGVRVREDAKWNEIAPVPGFEYRFKDVYLLSDKPVAGDFSITIDIPEQEPMTATGRLEFTPSLNLPKASYVPEPKPISTGKYQIGALYFPGWDNSANGGWPRIWKTAPERKPVLGWYDEANPEALDWHIKWLVENGIQYLMMDWYWNRGAQHLDHWVKGFQKCRYRKYLKWAVMWANHNGTGSHSVADQKKVVKWWIDNYFNMPEYLKIDGKPVVMIWNVKGMDVDTKKDGGVAYLNQMAQEMAREAGYPGIHFSAMRFPEGEVTKEKVAWLKDCGYDSTSIYRYREHAGRAIGARRFSFQILADTSMDYWRKRADIGMLPFFVNITSGWDDRPWLNHLEIYGKTPELFKKICEDAKQFVDETGREKWLLLGPVNEWGEGSYIEPCQEYGFKMYEAVRDTFGIKPAGGWPLNYGPTDVGLGPYDLPALGASPCVQARDWTFEDRAHSWRGSGLGETTYVNGSMVFTTTSNDPAMSVEMPLFNARDYRKAHVRMMVKPHENAAKDTTQLFWSTLSSTWAEPLSIRMPVIADGQFHDYAFDLEHHSLWRGKVTGLRFDPVCHGAVTVTIDRIWLEK